MCTTHARSQHSARRGLTERRGGVGVWGLPPQLRGRVGRGERQSYCYLITNKESTDKLAILAESTNGFVIAQRDLETRGPGDFLGKEQSGHINKVTLTGVSGSGRTGVRVLTRRRPTASSYERGWFMTVTQDNSPTKSLSEDTHDQSSLRSALAF